MIRHRGLLALLLLTAAVSGWVPTATVRAAEPDAAAPERPPVPEPSLEGVEEAVREQLETARAALDRLAADPELADRRLAAAFGQMGQLYLLYGFDAAAEVAFENARSLAPEQVAWSYYLGVILQERGELDAAEAALRELLDERPDDLATLIRLGRIELERGRAEAARDRFERAVEVAPDAAAAFEGLGQAESSLGNHEEAVRALERALELDPDASALHYPLALAHRQLGRMEKAREHLALRGDRGTSFPDPLWDGLALLGTGSSLAIERGNRAYQLGDLEAAAGAYRQAAEADPDDPQPVRALASVLTDLGNREEAAALYRRALRLEPDHAVTRYNLGNLLVAADRLDDAVEQFERAVELAPDFTNAHHNLARALEELGRLEDARAAAERAVASLPGDAESRLLHARLELEARLRGGTTLPEILEELRAGPQDGGAALVALGVLAAERGAEELALEAHRAAVDHEATEPPFAARAHLSLGEDLLSRERAEEALPHLRAASELGPDLAAAHLALGRALGRRGDLEGSVRAFARAAEVAPERLETHFGLATSLLLAGREAEARGSLERGIRSLPDGAELPLRHALARLLATAEDPEVRDGARALELAEEVFRTSPSIEHGETLAMAYAELGRFEEARAWQERVIGRAEEVGRTELLPELRRRLAAYRAGRPVRAPWS